MSGFSELEDNALNRFFTAVEEFQPSPIFQKIDELEVHRTPYRRCEKAHAASQKADGAAQNNAAQAEFPWARTLEIFSAGRLRPLSDGAGTEPCLLRVFWGF